MARGLHIDRGHHCYHSPASQCRWPVFLRKAIAEIGGSQAAHYATELRNMRDFNANP
jgi:hypothetical protein